MDSIADIAALAHKRDLSWDDVKGITWASVPADSDAYEMFDVRTVAGKCRDFREHYAPENLAYALRLDRWLSDCSKHQSNKSSRRL